MIRTRLPVGFVLGLLLLVSAQLTADTGETERILFDPPIATVQQGDTVQIQLVLDSGLSTVHGYRVKFFYDTTVVQLADIEPTDAWLDVAGGSFGQWFFWKDSVDQSNGQWHIDLFSYFFYQSKYIDGYAEIATVSFVANQAGGVTPLTFYDHLLEDTLLNRVAASSSDGLLYVCPLGFTPGNLDGDPSGNINIVDLTYIVAYLFNGGPAPVPDLLAGDANCDQKVNIVDLTYLVAYLFNGGPPPCDPCGR